MCLNVSEEDQLGNKGCGRRPAFQRREWEQKSRLQTRNPLQKGTRSPHVPLSPPDYLSSDSQSQRGLWKKTLMIEKTTCTSQAASW